MIELVFPDKSKKEYKKGITGLEIAKNISEGLARVSIAIKLNNKILDIEQPINESGEIKILTFKDSEGKEIFRHSSAHLLASAVIDLFPYAKPTIGPAVEEGFYYDFDHEPFSPEDISKIEAKMKEIVDARQPFERLEISKEKALEMFKDNQYKIEMIKNLPENEIISAYTHGDFIDLCRGPHIPNTGMLKAFKLTKIAGAYWKGDAKNKQLQRIYGISFPDKKELKQYLELIEEAKKRDHRKIGKELDLFSFHEEGPGFPFFHAKGMIVKNEIVKFWKEMHNNAGYEEIQTPIMLNRALWERSGHWKNYKENMYTTIIDEQDYAIKPMNCPGGMLVYKERLHSYKEFPLRVGEMGIVHRHELSGVLAGLFRVRIFTQDDSHLFMTPKQITDEIIGIINLADIIYSKYGLKYDLELSTRPEKSIGSDELWETATLGLQKALDKIGKPYKINEGDGAFYGPKIDFHLTDCIGRRWQCGTIQLDMALPERFDLTYEGNDGKKHRPVMLHRTIYGSLERFLGIITENYAGKFPLWLSPVQVRILTVADRHIEYANNILEKFKKAGIRVELDDRSESIPKKVREAQLSKINYILVVGDKEQENKTIAVRTRDNEVHGEKKIDDFMDELVEEIKQRN